MKPPPFRYYCPDSVSEALDLLATLGGEAKPLAGGQSLMPLLNLRLVRPAALVDLNRLHELAYIRRENGEIAIGALTRQRKAEFSQLLASSLPILTEAIAQIGHPAVRNRGTVGGSLAHADPAAELPCVLTALDATIVVAGVQGEKKVGTQDFFQDFYSTALSETELLKEVRIPLTPDLVGWSFMEFSRRHGDFALSEVAVLLFAEANGKECSRVRVVVGAVADRPLRLSLVERFLQREVRVDLSDGRLESILGEVEGQTLSALESVAVYGESLDYRRHLCGVLAARGVRIAVNRWREAWKRPKV